MHKVSVYIFQKDLRIEDNIGFSYAAKNSEVLYPIFILDDKYLNKFQKHFLLEVLSFLNGELKKRNSKIFVIKADFYKALDFIKNFFNPEILIFNRDFSWTGGEKEEFIKDFCKRNNLDYKIFIDNFLVDPYLIPATKVYTPFYKKWREHINEYFIDVDFSINTPHVDNSCCDFLLNLSDVDISEAFLNGLKRAEIFDFENYGTLRNFLHIDGTSKLSHFINWGVISIRKLYRRIKSLGDSQYLKELAFREFWYHIKLHFPETRSLEFQEKRRGIKWENDERLIEKFINGETGYPIVDACIRALKVEGWLHNRGRMILASFLTKTLLVDWKIGEKFFRDFLLDYDEVLNIQNWQWSASVGADPRPLRIFNPMIQSKKFDPNCEFIKKYIPELKNEECIRIHDPLTYPLNYYKPIVNFYEQREKTKRIYSIIGR